MLYDTRPKWFYLMSLCVALSIGTYVYYYPNPAGDSASTFHPVFLSQADASPYGLTKPGYFVYSDSCKISELPVRDPRLEKYFTPESFESCAHWNDGRPRLVGSNRTFLFVIKSALKYYSVGNSTHRVKCTYRPFTWKYVKGTKYGSIHAKYGRKEPLSRPVEIISDHFIRVECSLNVAKVYTDYFSFVPEPEHKGGSNVLAVDVEKTKFSVLILGIDAVSRLNFLRQMPKTYKYLENHYDLVDMRGYNKIGDNTFPNVVAALTGMSRTELEQGCWPTPKSTFDNCPFLWKNFSAHGFKSLFAEDSFQMSTFNYMKSGFRKSPADYFYNIFSKESEASIGNTRLLNANLCIGSQLIFKTILEYTLKFTTVLQSYFYFAFVWTSSLTHDFLNLPRVGDSILQNFVKNLNKNGNLNQTILVLTSDHGLRWGDYRETYHGHLEERLPFLFFVLPARFKDNYRAAFRNLLYNQHRLTTPYDLHETLKDLLDVRTIRDEALKEQRGNETSNTQRGVSLFRVVPESRTCEQAGIPAHYCTCHNKLVQTSLKSPIVLGLSRTLVSHINQVLLKVVSTKCYPLKVHKVLRAQYEQPISSAMTKKGNWTQRDYTISIVTVPGLAIFESTMRYNMAMRSTDIVGDVSRLNVYANQSSCVDDAGLKLYCYCR